jgi:hypothetical protein
VRALFRALSNVAELATGSIVLPLFGISEWMDTGAARVQSAIAVQLYRRDIVMRDFANEVCEVVNRNVGAERRRREGVDEQDEKVFGGGMGDGKR